MTYFIQINYVINLFNLSNKFCPFYHPQETLTSLYWTLKINQVRFYNISDNYNCLRLQGTVVCPSFSLFLKCTFELFSAFFEGMKMTHSAFPRSSEKKCETWLIQKLSPSNKVETFSTSLFLFCHPFLCIFSFILSVCVSIFTLSVPFSFFLFLFPFTLYVFYLSYSVCLNVLLSMSRYLSMFTILLLLFLFYFFHFL